MFLRSFTEICMNDQKKLHRFGRKDKPIAFRITAEDCITMQFEQLTALFASGPFSRILPPRNTSHCVLHPSYEPQQPS